MCGITGILNKEGGHIDREKLAQCTDLLTYRGPDDAGSFISGPIGFGHRRLKVIDLSQAAAQPMSTPDGRYTITYNGEIYNYQELAEKYLGDTQLVSTSDTEVLLHLLARRGVDIIPELRGMFALAFWDSAQQELILARDPFGKKPLYYLDTPDQFIFASEVKSLLFLALEQRRVDQEALTQYFLYEYAPAPATGWEQIKQVPMGSWLKVERGKMKQGTWWQPTVQPKRASADIEAELDELLRLAVERRLVADVPVGVFLSGGIDSTTIAWYMKQQQKDLHSFSVSFAEESFNEGNLAAQVAEELELTHHNTSFVAEDVVPTLRELVPKMDVPLGDASLLPTYAVSKLAAEQVTVVLDGDGSDELFGGYGTFQAAEVANRLPRWLRAFGQDLLPLAHLLPTQYDYFTFDFKVKSFLRGLASPLAIRNQIWLGSFTQHELRELLTSEWQANISQLYEPVTASSQEMADEAVADQVSWLTIKQYLHNGILTKLDRATMFMSLEARTPFLDIDVAEFALHLPAKHKRDKQILKKLMRGRIPDFVINRAKQGFALPLGPWLRGPLKPLTETVLHQEKLAADKILEPAVVQQLITEHVSGKADHRKKLWTLIAWQLWYDHWVAERSLDL